MQGGACYEEVHDLWQRVTKAEQAASEATAELCTHKDAARHATLEIKVRLVIGSPAIIHVTFILFSLRSDCIYSNF